VNINSQKREGANLRTGILKTDSLLFGQIPQAESSATRDGEMGKRRFSGKAINAKSKEKNQKKISICTGVQTPNEDRSGEAGKNTLRLGAV